MATTSSFVVVVDLCCSYFYERFAQFLEVVRVLIRIKTYWWRPLLIRVLHRFKV
jgi:hypothetical protein